MTQQGVSVTLLAQCPRVGTTEVLGGPSDGQTLVYLEMSGIPQRFALDPADARALARKLKAALTLLGEWK